MLVTYYIDFERSAKSVFGVDCKIKDLASSRNKGIILLLLQGEELLKFARQQIRREAEKKVSPKVLFLGISL